MHHTLRTGLAGIAASAVVASAFAFTAPANAGVIDDEGGCANPPVPASTNPASPGAAPVAVNDTANARSGGSVLIDVLANDTDADTDHADLSLINVQSGRYGETQICDGQVQYYVEDAPNGTATDTFRYGITDGEYYRTAKVTVTISPIQGEAPVVTKKLVVSHGKAVRKAEIKVTNPDDALTFEFVAGHLNDEDDPAIFSPLAPHQTKLYHTALRNLDFVIVATDDDESFYSEVLYGRIDTLTGKVTLDTDGGFLSSASAGSAGGTALSYAKRSGSASYYYDECGNAPVPGSSNPATPGAAPVTSPDAVGVVTGGSALVDVLANDTDADTEGLSLIGASDGRYGRVSVCDGEIEYDLTDNPPTGTTDTIRYAVTDGEAYRTGELTVTVQHIDVKTPKVTMKRLTSTAGVVTRKGEITVTNPDATYGFRFVAYPSSGDDGAISSPLAPGQTKKYHTLKRHLQFVLVAVGEDGEGLSSLQYGEIDTVTGKVKVYTDEDEFDGYKALRAAARATR